MKVETCDIDAFLENQWRVVDEVHEIHDFLQSPTFDVYDGLMIRIGSKYEGVYLRGKFRNLRNNFDRCAWDYNSDCIKFKKHKSWLEAWRQCFNPVWMAYSLCQTMPTMRMVEVAMFVIQTYIDKTNYQPTESFKICWNGLIDYRETQGRSLKLYHSSFASNDLERAIHACSILTTHRNYFQSVFNSFDVWDQETIAVMLKKLIPPREIMNLLFP